MEENTIAKYQVYEVSYKKHYKWKTKNFFGKETEKEGTYELNSKPIVAETKEEAISKYKKRHDIEELGIMDFRVRVDTPDSFGGFYAKNAELVKIEFKAYIPRNISVDYLKSKLQFNDFFKIATYYEDVYKEQIKQ